MGHLPSISSGTHWTELTTQQLVRYEALFKLFDELQAIDDTNQIFRLVAAQWKYFANVNAWHLVMPFDRGYKVIDGLRGEAQVAEVNELSPWDELHWELQRPHLIAKAELAQSPLAPEHLRGPAVAEVIVLPILRRGSIIGLLCAAARDQPFTELDKKFIRIFGGQFADRICDILTREEETRLLVERATHDALTGLLNRGAIVDRLEKELALSRRTGQPVSVAIADVDLFKGINDNYGHLAGDSVLREVARRFREQARDGDSLGRYGGEEFLFVLFPCNEDEVAKAAERFRRAIADTIFSLKGHATTGVGVTISLGTACTLGQQNITLEGLLKQADDALYKSKEEGRNRVTAGTPLVMAAQGPI